MLNPVFTPKSVIKNLAGASSGLLGFSLILSIASSVQAEAMAAVKKETASNFPIDLYFFIVLQIKI